MPRYYDIVCEFCGEPARRPGNSPPKYCSRKCYRNAKQQEISDRIGEPLTSAIMRRYVLLRMSYREIANELQVNFRTVMRNIIEPRQGSEAVQTQWENNDERRRNIGSVFSKSSKERVGKNHHRWRGGHKYDVSAKWSELTKQIRERDNYCCTRCGKTNEENLKRHKRHLSVHHIVPFILSNDNSPENLRTLCLECHRTVEAEFLWVL